MLGQIRLNLLKIARCQSAITRYTTSKRRRKLLQNNENTPELKYKVPRPEDRRIYAWGLAETGALGVHKNIKKNASRECLYVQHPTRIQFAEQFDVTAIAAGYGFSIYITKNSRGVTAFGTGINTDSQLGFQRNKYRHTLQLVTYPVPIEIPHRPVIKCAAGRAHTLLLTDAGVYTLGNNAYGQCGRPVIQDENYLGNPTMQLLNVTNEDLEDVFCGQDHSMILTKNGKLFSFGWGTDGQTGLGHFESVHVPTEVKGDIKGERIVKVACSGDCNLALNDKGEVFGWGNTEYGQLIPDTQQVNLPTHLNLKERVGKVTDIASGGSFCSVVNENGDVFVWGYGILGFGPKVDHATEPQRVPPTLFGRNEFNPNARVVKIVAGLTHMATVDDQGDLFSWGKNKYACLGLGHDKDQFFPFKVSVNAKVVDVKCGPDHMLALCRPFS